MKNVKKEREAFKVEKIKNEWKFPFRTLTPYPPRLNGNSLDSPNPPGMEMSIHFFIFSSLMASLSEMCRGLSVPSIDISPHSHNLRKIRFVYPSSSMHRSWRGLTRFNHINTTPYIPTNKLVNKWVKLSHSLERKMMGYVSIKLFFNYIFAKVNGQTITIQRVFMFVSQTFQSFANILHSGFVFSTFGHLALMEDATTG